MRFATWPYRATACASVLALACIAGGSDALAITSVTPSLKVSMPASLTRGSPATITASGNAGQYNEVAISTVKGSTAACHAPGVNTIGMQTVAKNRSFTVKVSNIFGAPGVLTVCVYLYTSTDPQGRYLAKSEHLRVT